jgi:hypothetical protein
MVDTIRRLESVRRDKFKRFNKTKQEIHRKNHVATRLSGNKN